MVSFSSVRLSAIIKVSATRVLSPVRLPPLRFHRWHEIALACWCLSSPVVDSRNHQGEQAQHYEGQCYLLTVALFECIAPMRHWQCSIETRIACYIVADYFDTYHLRSF